MVAVHVAGGVRQTNRPPDGRDGGDALRAAFGAAAGAGAVVLMLVGPFLGIPLLLAAWAALGPLVAIAAAGAAIALLVGLCIHAGRWLRRLEEAHEGRETLEEQDGDDPPMMPWYF